MNNVNEPTFLHQVLLGACFSGTTRPSHDVGDEPIVSGSLRASRMVPAAFSCDVVVAFYARKTSHQHPRTTDISQYLSHHRRAQTPANVPCCACTAASCERPARCCGDSCWLSSGTELIAALFSLKCARHAQMSSAPPHSPRALTLSDIVPESCFDGAGGARVFTVMQNPFESIIHSTSAHATTTQRARRSSSCCR